MYAIKVNISKNRLYLKLKGKLDSAQVYNGSLEVFHQASQLKHGFTTVFDMDEFEPLSDSGLQAVQTVLKKLSQSGQSKLVRIVPEHKRKSLEFNVNSKYLGISSIDVISAEEAEVALEYK